MKKKKILIMSDFTLAKTGFGRVMKALITYLYKTNKYEIVHYCCGLNYSNPSLAKTPWKSVGCLPDNQQEMDALNRDPNAQRTAGYGSHFLDRVMVEEKPDFFLASQDIWGVDFSTTKFWWNKIPCVIWTTLDSLPILPSALELAPKIKNYWVWSNFAEKEMHKLGHKHIKTVHACIDESKFYRLPDDKRLEIRKSFNISSDTYIAGFVFRNQLRKSVPNLLEGFQLFRQNNPEVKNSKLLLHTSFIEGWNIFRLADQYKVPHSDILTTYLCYGCNKYEVRNYAGESQPCKCCGADKSMFTTNVGKGISESQLNEVYNLMDVYVHPFTSGATEIPLAMEAKYTELITLCTKYSCGEEICEDTEGSIPLDFSYYTEHGTEFLKASTYPSSIAKQLARVLKMKPEEKRKREKMSREWALKTYSCQNTGKIIENFIDNSEVTNFNFEKENLLKNPDAVVPEIEDDKEWLKALYKNILKMDVTDQDSGLNHWMGVLNSK